MSLRLRLALGLSALVIVAAAIFGVFVHQTAYRIARDDLRRRLTEEAGAIINRYGVSRRELVLPGEATARLEFFARTRDVTGLAAIIPPDLTAANRPLPLSSAGGGGARGGSWSEIVIVDDESLLVHTEPVLVENSVIGVAQVARSFEAELAGLDTLSQQLLAGSVAMTVIAFGLIWLAIGISLRPVDRLTAAVEGMRARRDYGRRLRTPYADGEMGRLAMAIDGLVSEAEDAYQRAQSNLSAQQRFFAQVSHELRAPLTTIRGNLGLLQRGASVPDPDRTEILRDAIDEAERLTRLVNELSAMSRAASPHGLRLEPVQVRDIVFDVARKARMIARDRRLLVDAGEDALVNGNRDAITQILIVLIDNAAKFTQAGGTIGIQLRREGRDVALTVRDNGSGVAPEVLPVIFEPYQAGDLGRNPNGLGLGLAIARQLAEAQGGRISADSVPGEGSAFTVIFPAL
ncbi:MAG: HAMP domain-containing histidine kinase [Anaerolineae bacterium]|nr:HAMP domain-containing histidine kinase [Anaerolineae bacterium]